MGATGATLGASLQPNPTPLLGTPACAITVNVDGDAYNRAQSFNGPRSANTSTTTMYHNGSINSRHRCEDALRTKEILLRLPRIPKSRHYIMFRWLGGNSVEPRLAEALKRADSPIEEHLWELHGTDGAKRGFGDEEWAQEEFYE